MIRVAHQLADQGRQGAQPLDISDARNADGLLSGMLMAFPDFQVFIRLAQEQDFAHGFIRMVWKQG